MEHTNNKLIIFSAPSGSGKTTIVQHLIKTFPHKLGFSISACTRHRRGRNEVDGEDYYFMDKEQFEEKIHHAEFVEWEQVYNGAYYGTLKTEIERIWAQGKAVIFDVDVQGALKLKEYFGEVAKAIFVKVPSIDVLKERLKQRKTESDATLKTRLAKAEFEMSFEGRFDIILNNIEIEKALNEAQDIVTDFLDLS